MSPWATCFAKSVTVCRSKQKQAAFSHLILYAHSLQLSVECVKVLPLLLSLMRPYFKKIRMVPERT